MKGNPYMDSISQKFKRRTVFSLGNRMEWLAAAVSLFSIVAGASGIGYRETGGVHVPGGTSETLSGNIIEGTDAKFFKSGEGTLTVPLSQVNRQTDWNLVALGGTMTVTPGDDATVDVDNPPAILSKAKMWLDQSSVVTTNGTCPWTDGEALLCAKWVDVRDKANPDSPQHVYATPAWTEYTAINHGDYVGVPPMQTTVDGRTALFFYGAKGVHLEISETIVNTIQFVVHGIRATGGVWGPVIGSTEGRAGGYLTSTSALSAVPAYSGISAHFASRRLDCTPSYAKSRNYLDGVPMDPFSEKPKNAFQLFETCFCGRRQRFDRIFFNHFDGYKTATTPQGGDYVSEIIVFDVPVSEAERLEIERYLLAKWNLPAASSNGTYLRYPEKTGLLGAASNATVVVQTDSGTTPPVALAGEGEIRKTTTGSLIVGLGDVAESSGRLTIDGGDVIVRSGRTPAQKAEGGSYYNASVYHPSGTRTADLDAAAGVKLARTTGAGAGKVVKQGNDWVRFNEIDQDVKDIEVAEGTLQLESKPLVAHYACATGGIGAVIENADFEMAFTTNASNGRCSITPAGLNGWRGGAFYIAWTNSAAQVWFGEGAGVGRPYGNHVLLLNQTSKADATITIPQAGYYEFECSAKNRYDPGVNSVSFSFVTLSVGRDESSLSAFGELHANGQQFNRYRFGMPYLEAGTYVLRLSGTYNNTDGATLFDSVRVSYVGANDDDVAFTVPNGDFETLVPDAARPFYWGYSLDNEISGWTLAVTNATFASYSTNTLIGAVSPLLHREYTCSLYDEYNVRRGCKALAMLHNGAYARTTFTAPAGRFLLRGTVIARPLNFKPVGASKEYQASAVGNVKATLTLSNGTVLDLGNVRASSTIDATAQWGTVFEIPVQQQVTLELSQTVAAGSALVDDLVFVTEKWHAGKANLIVCPGAETTDWGSWSGYVADSYWKNSSASYMVYSNSNTHAYGYNAFEGNRVFSFQCAGGRYQTIAFNEAGRYRFTCHSRTRADNASYSGNGIRFWMTKSGSNVTNFHNILLLPYCRNFIERSWLVNVPEPGNWIFGMNGTGVAGSSETADRMSFLDGLSLVRADDREDVPSVPEKMRIAVATGSRLVLDYPGTVKVRRLTLGGVRKEGIVSAATDPDYIGGIGKLEIVPSGVIIRLK